MENQRVDIATRIDSLVAFFKAMKRIYSGSWDRLGGRRA
jgi:hypothetical protein